ncbi:MAG: hypothetical protein M3209_00275 [Acidobacteriota bacterium]|nr:hypothetical protein [Acidobacteriota bacterium]
MNWEAKQANILETTRRSLNAERQCVFPPVGDTITFLEENEDQEFVSLGQLTNDWTLGFQRDEKREQYFVEILATRKDELPEKFGQSSYIAMGDMIFQVHEFFRTQTLTDLQQPFLSPNLRPTIKIYCAIVDQSAIDDE